MKYNQVLKTVSGLIVLTLLSAVVSCSGSKEAIKPEAATTGDKVQSAADLPSAPAAAAILESRVLIGKKGIDEAFPCISPDSSRLVFQRREAGGNWQIWQYDFARDTATVLLEQAGSSESPFYSPDGSKIVFTSDKDGTVYDSGLKSRDLWLMDSDGMKVRKLTDSKSDNWRPVFTPDGNKIYFASNRNDSEQKYYEETAAVFSYDLTTGKIDELLPTVEYKNNPSVSPDGKTLAFTNKDNRLEIISLESGLNGRVLSDEQSQSGGAAFSSDGSKIYFHIFKNNSYEILCYSTANDASSTVITSQANSRAPYVLGGSLYYHSNQHSDYDIYIKNLK